MQRPKKNPSKPMVWKWFLSLDLDEKARVLSIEDKDSVQLIQKMYKKKVQEGDGLFFAVDDGFEDMVDQFPQSTNIKKSQYIFTNKNDFCYKKLSCLDEYRIINYPEYLLGPDRELENSIRLCDTREYLDTMTVATSLLENPYHFLYLMERASRGSFLTHPCKVDYISRVSQWVWQSPTWFNGMGFYSLGTYICHKLEQALWMRYWEYKQLDPRVAFGKRRYIFPNNNSQGLLTKTHLTEFWINTEPLVRLQILGGLGSIVDTALRDSELESSKEKQPKVPSTSSIAAFRKNRKGSDAARNSVFPIHDIRLLSALVDFSMEKKAVEFLFASHADKSKVNHRAFIEILYFSPLKTAGTPTNYVLRRLGFIIQKAYMEKLKMDLILGEESEKKKKRNIHKGKKKKGNNKKKIFKRKLAASSTPTKKPQASQPKNPKPVKQAKPPTPTQKTTKQKSAPPAIKSVANTPKKKLNSSLADTAVSLPPKNDTTSMTDKQQQQQPAPITTPSHNTAPRPSTSRGTKRKSFQRTISSPLTLPPEVQRNPQEQSKKRASLSPSTITRKSHFSDQDSHLLANKAEEGEEGEPFPNLDNDNCWFEVTKRKKKKKRTESCNNSNSSTSAPVSPRNTKRTHRPRRSSSGASIVQKNVIPINLNAKQSAGQQTHPRPTQTSSNHPTDPKEPNRNRSLSSPILSPKSPSEEQESPKKLPNSNLPMAPPPTRSASIVNSEPRSRSSSCSPQPKTPSASSRRSHSASARSKRKAPPLRQCAKEAPTQTTSYSPTKKRVLIEKPNTVGRSRFHRGLTRKRAQMNVLHTHEVEHEIAGTLGSEIDAYVSYLKQVVRNHQMRLADKIVQRIRCIVGSLWSSAEVKIYGSVSTGLCIPESDLDLVVYIPDAVSVGGSPVLLLAGELKGKPWVKQIQPIYTAKVPVIKLVVDEVAVDITFDVRSQAQPNTYAHTDLDHSNTASSHSGLSTSKYILQLKKDFPALEPLVLILKQYLYCVMLNNSYTGGLASYSLVLMVASYLKFYGKQQQNLGTLLLGFFELYGKLFDYSTVGISLCEAEGFFSRDENCFKHYGPAQILIIDPLCPSNNVSSGTFAMYRVKQAFANGYNTLTDRFASPFIPSPLSKLLPIVINSGFAPVNY